MRISVEQFKSLKKIPNSPYDSIKPYFLFHSNKLEGSTFSITELERLIQSKKVEGVHEFDDVIETYNSVSTFDYLIDSLRTAIDKKFVISLNTKLLVNTSMDQEGFVGHYKYLGNMISGTKVQVTLPAEVESGMEELFSWWYKTNKTLESIVHFHVRFEHIHPFQDGNGRTGRFLILKQCIENDIDIPIIEEKNENEYKTWLEMAQVYGNEAPLLEIFKKAQMNFDEKMKSIGINDFSDYLVPIWPRESIENAKSTISQFSLSNEDHQPYKKGLWLWNMTSNLMIVS